jgi:hypothetical protein
MEKFLDIRIEDVLTLEDKSKIQDQFKIDFPLIITGVVDFQYHEKLEVGYYIEFAINNKTLLKKIVDISFFTLPIYYGYDEVKTRSVSLLIECESRQELNKILKAESIYQIGTIYKNTK